MLLIREGGHKTGTRPAQEEILEITKETGFHVFNKYAKKSLNSKCFSRLEKVLQCNVESKAAKWTLE